MSLQKRDCQENVLISAAIIAKDEEEHIGRLLESLVGLVDEVVLIDTGSSDRTIDIAREFGATIIRSPWAGDFSYHRNEAIEACNGKYVLIVDADDEVVDTDFNETRTMLAGGEVTDVMMVRYRITYPSSAGITIMTPRLFRKDSGARYVHRIHEQLRVTERCPVMVSNVAILHHGYCSEEEMIRKEERNLSIAMQIPDDDAHGLHCRARAAVKLERWPLAFASAKALLDLRTTPHTLVEGCVMLGISAARLGREAELQEAIERAQALAPDNPDVKYLQLIRSVLDYGKAIGEGEHAGDVEYLRPHLLWHVRNRVDALLEILVGTPSAARRR